MISVIVCSRKDPSWVIHEKQVSETIGCEYEYIRIDNTRNKMGICAAYNLGTKKASGEILVFVHEDVFFASCNWGRVLHEKFDKDNAVGLVGVAGTKYLYKNNPLWPAAGQPFIAGQIIHEEKKENKLVLTIFARDQQDAEVVAVDGLFFSVRASLFSRIGFDESTFDKFHFYDLDISMQVRKTHKLLVTSGILVKHLSAGSFDATWKRYGSIFLAKYQDELPASCTDQAPDGDVKGRVRAENVDLAMVLSSESVGYIRSLDEYHDSEVMDVTLPKLDLLPDFKRMDYYNRANISLLRLLPCDAKIIVDVGCGAGALASRYRLNNPDVRYLGIEMDEEAANFAIESQRVDKIVIGNVEELDLEDLGITPGDVDCLVYGDVLEHLVDPWETLKRHADFLSSNGIVLACIPNIGHWSILYNLLSGVWRYEDEGLMDRTHLRFFTLQGIHELFSQAGLQIQEVKGLSATNEVHNRFAQVMGPALQQMGLQFEFQQFMSQTSAYQYVVRARKSG